MAKVANPLIGFQSLFCWNQVWELFNSNSVLKIVSVSILVLLESGLGAVTVTSSPLKMFCFNPCSAGIRSGSALKGSFDRVPCRFQSLFCWNQVWETFFQPAFSATILVSILVLLESGLGEERILQFIENQSSFNPCSAGIRSGSMLLKRLIHAVKKFQSLFCWNQVWERAGSAASGGTNMFQSLFCWNQVWEIIIPIL